jgi:hypothetical protein
MKIIFRQSWTKILTIVPLFLLIFASKTLAHHATGGQTPDNFWNGFLSGLAHPVIGLDHLAFVVASGLIAVGMEQGLLIPIAFAIATLIGTGIHLQGINLLFPEGIIALSVVIFGVILTLKKGLQNHSNLYTDRSGNFGNDRGNFPRLCLRRINYRGAGCRFSCLFNWFYRHPISDRIWCFFPWQCHQGKISPASNSN